MHRNDEEASTSRRAYLAEFTQLIDDVTTADGDHSLTSARLPSEQNTREYPADSTDIFQERSSHKIQVKKKKETKTKNKQAYLQLLQNYSFKQE